MFFKKKKCCCKSIPERICEAWNLKDDGEVAYEKLETLMDLLVEEKLIKKYTIVLHKDNGKNPYTGKWILQPRVSYTEK